MTADQLPRSTPRYDTLADWIEHEAISFATDAPGAFDAAVDKLIAALGDGVRLLGIGEALHGGEEFLLLRNRLFQRLAEVHGYSAITVESSFPRGRLMNDYVAGRGPDSYEAVQEVGFSHGFGRLDANRDLVEWMRRYNADPAHQVKLRFYGFDSPTEATGTDSPGPVLHFVLDYLDTIGGDSDQARRERIAALLGADADWENPAALMDPSAGIGQSPAANALRVETEDLISKLQIRRPELADAGGADRYWEAWQYALVTRQLLNYHAALARSSEQRLGELLGIRDAMMGDMLAYTLLRERGRGKVLAFAHNSHVRHGRAEWQLGPHLHTWWAAGSHAREILGTRYAVIGAGLGVSEANEIGQPEPGTLEALLTRSPGQALFIPTHSGHGLPATEIAALPIRSGSALNGSYMPLNAACFGEFDWLVVLPSATYTRGGPPLQWWKGNAEETS